MITTLVGILIGALITWGVTHVYYKKAGDELKNEAKKLREMNTLMSRALENASIAEFNRDSEQNPTGLVIKLSGSVKSTSSALGELTVGGKERISNLARRLNQAALTSIRDVVQDYQNLSSSVK